MTLPDAELVARLPIAAWALFALIAIGLLYWLRTHQFAELDGSSHLSPDAWAEAEERAERLLHLHLSDAERLQLTWRGYLQVPSPGFPGRVYRIPREPGLVELREGDELRVLLCVEPVQPLPSADLVLLHKLFIEGDEDHYLGMARRYEGELWLWRLGNGRWD